MDASGGSPAGGGSERVLATLNADGSRRWLKPRVSKGRFLTARRVVAYALIGLFTLLPYASIGGKPAMLFDIASREFHLFGKTFLPTDTALMAVLMMCVVVAVFLVTALFGRVWCGWACPQTVYMEFLYRPIERLFDGAPGRRARPVPGWRKAAKYAAFFVCSVFLAHTFLAYFIGVERLAEWVTRSPLEHPTAFGVMAVTTGLMMFDFCFFREQTCLVACPYGRLQAAMLDRHSLIVTYDERRGEPRGKKRRRGSASGDVPLDVLGDCIDCKLCVTTCPTGIDIRDGLQMECIGCAQCVDACDAVMDKIGRPRGLVRYSSQAVMEGKAKSLVRARTLLYPLILVGLLVLFVVMLSTKRVAEASVLPRQGLPFYELSPGVISNQVRLRLVNRGEAVSAFGIAVADPLGAALLDGAPEGVELEPAGTRELGFSMRLPAEVFSARGRYEVELVVTNDAGYEARLPYVALGPAGGGGERAVDE